MRYSLRTLIIVMMVGGPVLAGVWAARAWLLPLAFLSLFFLGPLGLLMLQVSGDRSSRSPTLIVLLVLWLAFCFLALLMPAVQT